MIILTKQVLTYLVVVVVVVVVVVDIDVFNDVVLHGLSE